MSFCPRHPYRYRQPTKHHYYDTRGFCALASHSHSLAMSTSKQQTTTTLLNESIHLRQEQLLRHSPYAEQLRRVGLDLFNENSRLAGRVKALEQAVEEERASVRLLMAMRDARRQQQLRGSGGKRRASLAMFVPSKKREVLMPGGEEVERWCDA